MNIKNYKWTSDFAKTHIAMGEAKMLLLVLEARGIAVPDDVRERVTSCADPEQLERWIQRAVVIDKAEDLLD